MSDFSEASAAPIPIRYGDRDYQASPYTIQCWGKLMRWIRKTIISSAREAVEDLPRVERDAVIDRAIIIANSISLSHAVPSQQEEIDAKIEELKEVAIDDSTKIPEVVDQIVQLAAQQANSMSDEAKMVTAIMQSPEGMLQVLYISLSVHHKNIGLDKVEEVALGMEEELAEIIDQIIQASTQRMGGGRGEVKTVKEKAES